VDLPADDDRALHGVAALLGAVVRSLIVDGTGWRWRVSWGGIELGAWNDMDGVAVMADIGPWDDWVGMAGAPADPGPDEALRWAVSVLEPWLALPAHAERIAERTARRLAQGDDP